VSGKQLPLFPETSKTSDELNILRDLDRSDVEPLATEILREIEPYCQKAVIVGSIRRQRCKINDIDILVLPTSPTSMYHRPTSDMWRMIIKDLRNRFYVITEKQGEKLFTGYVPFKGRGHVQVDLYRATADTWGILLLVRTGSKEHNVHLCNLAISKGLRLFYSEGLVKDGQIIACRTEEEVFQALGLPFIVPQDREVEAIQLGE
jgi:DNA polymerase (family 10)